MNTCPVCYGIPLVDVWKKDGKHFATIGCLASTEHAAVAVECAPPQSAFAIAEGQWNKLPRKAAVK
jgi:hypothetical protein